MKLTACGQVSERHRQSRRGVPKRLGAPVGQGKADLSARAVAGWLASGAERRLQCHRNRMCYEKVMGEAAIKQGSRISRGQAPARPRSEAIRYYFLILILTYWMPSISYSSTLYAPLLNITFCEAILSLRASSQNSSSGILSRTSSSNNFRPLLA